MSLELKVSLTTNLEYILRASQSIQMTIESISGYFRDMSDWCAINLDEGTWYFSDLVTVSDKDSNEMVFAHKVTFDNEEDATAFKIKFGILDQMYAIRKLPDAKKTVFINFPPTAMAQPLPEHIQWLVDHKINFGFMFGKPVGVYLSREDATAFKLKYGS